MSAPSHTYDPFGEQTEPLLPGTTALGDRRARRAALAVFWTLAVLLTAGRVWQHEVVFSHPVQIVSR